MSVSQSQVEVMTITLEHSGPVELHGLTASLTAIANYHARYAERIGASINGDRVKLYVKEIRSGSIVVDLVALATTVALPIMSDVNSVVSFTRTLFGLTDYLRGLAAQPPADTVRRDVQDVVAFLEPVASDPRSTMTIVAREGSTVTVHQTITSDTAAVTQNRAGAYLAKLAEPVSGRYEGMVFYWFQARDSRNPQAGDRGIVEALYAGPVKTIFSDPSAKAAMLAGPLFQKFYVVDLTVQSVGDRPVLYTIVAVREAFDRDD